MISVDFIKLTSEPIAKKKMRDGQNCIKHVVFIILANQHVDKHLNQLLKDCEKVS